MVARAAGSSGGLRQLRLRRRRRRSTPRSDCRSSRPRSAKAWTRSAPRGWTPARARLAERHPRRPPHAHRLERRPRFDRRRWCEAASRSDTNTSRSPTTRRIPAAIAQPDRRRGREAGRRNRRAARAVSAHRRSCTAARSTSSPTAGSTSAIAILERFDIVLASLHERAGHSPEQLLARYVSAMRHPLVTMITHPTNRLVPLSARLRARLRPAVRDGRRDGDARRNRRCAVAPRSRRRARPARDRGRCDRRHRQRLSPRRDARPPDAARRHDRAARLGRSPPRPQHASARGGPRVHRRETRPIADARGTAAAVVGVRRLRALPRDPAAGLRSRRHRVVPDDGRLCRRSRRATATRCISPSPDLSCRCFDNRATR